MLWQGTRRGALSALCRGTRGAFPLLSLVRVATAHEDRRVLRAAPARRRQGTTRVALAEQRPARALQRVERDGRRRERGIASGIGGGSTGPLPQSGQAADVSARRSST